LNKGKLVVISGPSGAGKSSLIKELISANSNKLSFSVSYTSRKPREGEVDGKDYFFVTEEHFKDDINKSLFIEWAHVHGNYYGTSRDYIYKILDEGKDCILDIDVQGALNLMSKNIDAKYIFVAPPNIESLRNRLMGRGTEVTEAIELRVRNAIKELSLKDRYQFVVVNDKFEKALKELENIILK